MVVAKKLEILITLVFLQVKGIIGNDNLLGWNINMHVPVGILCLLTFIHSILFRLQVYGLYEVRVSGDGNCQVSGTFIQNCNWWVTQYAYWFLSVRFQFRALSDQLYRTPEYHKHVRKEVAKQVYIQQYLLSSHLV